MQALDRKDAEPVMKMPDPARRERQRALIEKGIETPFFRDHIKVFEKTVAEMEVEVQLGKTTWLASNHTLWQMPKSRPIGQLDWSPDRRKKPHQNWPIGNAMKSGVLTIHNRV
jgi:hypothetical protein